MIYNEAGNYDPSSGIYTVPHNGSYWIHTQVVTPIHTHLSFTLRYSHPYPIHTQVFTPISHSHSGIHTHVTFAFTFAFAFAFTFTLKPHLYTCLTCFHISFTLRCSCLGIHNHICFTHKYLHPGAFSFLEVLRVLHGVFCN